MQSAFAEIIYVTIIDFTFTVSLTTYTTDVNINLRQEMSTNDKVELVTEIRYLYQNGGHINDDNSERRREKQFMRMKNHNITNN